jgi:hypothetical protein
MLNVLPKVLTNVAKYATLSFRSIKFLLLGRKIIKEMGLLKKFFGVLADLFDSWSDGSNDPGDVDIVFDAVSDLVEGEWDDELDALLGKPYVGFGLGFLSSVLRKLSD